MAATATFTMIDLDDAEQDLNAVDRAVQMLEDGTYGQCTVCGTSLINEVASAPLTFTCAAHATMAPEMGDDSAEEEAELTDEPTVDLATEPV
jgi:hypothetical protein